MVNNGEARLSNIIIVGYGLMQGGFSTEGSQNPPHSGEFCEGNQWFWMVLVSPFWTCGAKPAKNMFSHEIIYLVFSLHGHVPKWHLEEAVVLFMSFMFPTWAEFATEAC